MSFIDGEPAPPAQWIASISVLEALHATSGAVVYLGADGRFGYFKFDSSDLSTEVTADTEQGIYVAPSSDATGASGAWVRQFSGAINVLWFGADPTHTNDSYAAFAAARDYLQTSSDYRGGTIYVPKGRYKLNTTLAFTAYATGHVHNIFLRGDGEEATALDFAGCSANTDGITFDAGAHFGVFDLAIENAQQDGISLNPGATVASGSYCNYFAFERVRIQGSSRDGMRQCNSYMGIHNRIWSKSNGANGFAWLGYHTSLAVTACHAYSNTAGVGFSINGMVYSKFSACGADGNKWGYNIKNVASVEFSSCGGESQARDTFLLQTSDASVTGSLPTAAQNIKGLVFTACYGYHASSDGTGSYGTLINAVTANSRPIEFSMEGCVSYKLASGDYSVIVNSASGTIKVTEVGGCNFDSNPLISATSAVYWEGRELTFTPTVVGTTTAGTGTYSVQSGSYRLVGKRVFYNIALTWSAHTGTGNIGINGLPLTVSGNFPADLYYSNLTYTNPPFALAANGGTSITLAQAASGAAASLIPMDTSAQLIISGNYTIL